MKPALQGRRLVVAGGGQGIGRATVDLFLREGARVAVIDRDPALLATLPEAVARAQADVTDTIGVDSAMQALEAAMGGIDGLVNCVGVDLRAAVEEIEDTAWDRAIGVNLTGAMKLCRAATPALRRAGGGTIVNLSSAAGLTPLRNRSGYAASKAGLQMFSKCLAMDLAADGIRVNVVCPGAVETPLFRESIDSQANVEAQLQAVRDRYALARIAEPEEIAAAILWLTGDSSSYVTGVALAVDGGRSFH